MTHNISDAGVILLQALGSETRTHYSCLKKNICINLKNIEFSFVFMIYLLAASFCFFAT